MTNWLQSLLIHMIQFYRSHISPGRPPCCRFLPTCSAYALEAIQVHGPWRGSWLALRRFSKCHPFHRQKSFVFDPVPPRNPPKNRPHLPDHHP